jgi:hypothetical protein
VAEVQLTDEQRKTLQRWSRRVTSAQALPRPWSSAAGFLCMKIGYNPARSSMARFMTRPTVDQSGERRPEWLRTELLLPVRLGVNGDVPPCKRLVVELSRRMCL